MSQLLYLLADSTTGVIQHAQYAQPTTVPGGQTVEQIEDDVPNAMETLGAPTAYQWSNGSVVQRPYLTLAYTNGTVTATLNIPPTTPPDQVIFTVLGQQYTATLTNNQASIQLGIHPSVTTQVITVTASAQGCFDGETNIGGSNNQVALQVYTPTGGVPTVAPTGPGSRSFESAYWTSTAVNQAFSLADISTGLGLLEDWVYNIVVPALQKGNLVTLTDNQGNHLADAQAGPANASELPVTADQAAPKPASGAAQIYDFHYSHYKATKQAMATAMENYANAVATIPGLD